MRTATLVSTTFVMLIAGEILIFVLNSPCKSHFAEYRDFATVCDPTLRCAPKWKVFYLSLGARVPVRACARVRACLGLSVCPSVRMYVYVCMCVK